MRKTRLQRWEAKVIKGDGCWLWSANHTTSGYGIFSWQGVQRTTAHRAGYLLLVGPIPDGYQIDHLCRNVGCVNPAHMEAVTPLVNRRRGYTARGTDLANGRKTHCPKGHPYAGDNLRAYPGHRVCIECSRTRSREWYRRNRAA